MLIHDDIYTWKGWGGNFNLAAGSCRLRIFDLTDHEDHKITHLKPIIVVVSDLPAEAGTSLRSVSVRSCCSHIASSVAEEFDLDPSRMMFVEYSPESFYGNRKQHLIAEKVDVVDLKWHGRKALHPQWRPLKSPLREILVDMMDSVSTA
ncbi:MAG: hypothetical protein HKM93_23135 [Desulfobacteraceae bacterium]|nr:hypothetical protein [Desulfobacteraceae bacterium]